ncbi:MAG: YdcF family protein [Hyphomicrobium sp.]
MFYFASKILFFIFQPSSLAAILLVLGIWGLTRSASSKWAIAFSLTGLGWIVLAGLLPIGNILIFPLEQRFPILSDQQLKSRNDVAGIILLGGFEDGAVTAGRGQLMVNEAAERLTEGVRLARVLGNAKIVFTGGVGRLMGGSEASGPVSDYLQQVGIDKSRIITEGVSRNTFENAELTKKLVAPKSGETWLLVTSAYHMPRAIGVFRKVGFDVLAYPVDFRTAGIEDLWRPFPSIPDGLKRADLVVKEWIGLVAYWLSDRSSALFPHP